ncbi:MAG TPA: 16S rRNA (guanine(527)-N(7))-methyltransferase RsmG [Dehalococcoidia bacterium]
MAPDKAAALARYAAMIRAERERASLLSRGSLDEIEQRHFAESLALLRALEERELLLSPALDIGSGAGLPGLPIKIARPELRLTLLESNEKKAAFLERAITELGLDGADVITARAEEAGRLPEHRVAYKLALARAVAPLRVLAELALPFLALGGVLAAPKGSSAAKEVREAEAALTELGGAVDQTVPLEVPGAARAPTLVIVRKTGETPARYPRRPGIPRKRPL